MKEKKNRIPFDDCKWLARRRNGSLMNIVGRYKIKDKQRTFICCSSCHWWRRILKVMGCTTCICALISDPCSFCTQSFKTQVSRKVSLSEITGNWVRFQASGSKRVGRVVKKRRHDKIWCVKYKGMLTLGRINLETGVNFNQEKLFVITHHRAV